MKHSFERVIDSEIDLAQSVDAETEDRALRGRTSSADATSQTAGAAASGQPPAQGRSPPQQAQSEKSQGVRGTESPDSFDNTPRNRALRVRFFKGSTELTQFPERGVR